MEEQLKKLSRVFDIVYAIPVAGEHQERAAEAKRLLREVYASLEKKQIDHEYNKEG